MATEVLVVEDDGSVRRALERALPLHGLTVRAVADGVTALAELARGAPDLIILDVGLPGPDGLSLTARLRADGVTTPILMLTARDTVGDRVAGLEAGADDYLVKPFALEELVARLRALLRRVSDGAAPVLLRCADLVVDRDGHRARRGERDVVLSPTQFRLLERLVEHPGRVVVREVLMEELLGPGGRGENALEQHVAELRRRLEASGEPRLIHTVRGVGYVARP